MAETMINEAHIQMMDYVTSGIDEWHPHDVGNLAGANENTLLGTPGADVKDYVGQTTDFTCAVVSQEMILHQFGIQVSEAQLVYDATVNGWLTNHGTSLTDVGNLLNHYGVSTHSHHGADVESLAAELASGHKVIVAVNSNELWGTDWPFSLWMHEGGADHALVVTGIDLSDADHPQVLVNDPGDHHGACKSYPLEKFLRSWAGSGNYYVATDDAPPHLSDDPVLGKNFHADQGMYMDAPFWINLVSKAVGYCAESLAQHLLKHTFLNEDSACTTVHPLVQFDDSQRNHLFTAI